MMRSVQVGLIVVLLLSLTASIHSKVTGFPIVGIVLQPSSGSTSNIVPLGSKSHTYVPESYVQQITNAGGLPVLIPFDLHHSVLDKLLAATDMLFIPGGPADLVDSEGLPTKYQERVHLMIQRGVQRNQKGEYYPILATCLGFENVVISFAKQNISILQSG